MKQTKLTPATVNKAIERLTALNIVNEVTGKKRGRLFRYSAYLQELNQGTEPLGN